MLGDAQHKTFHVATWGTGASNCLPTLSKLPACCLTHLYTCNSLNFVPAKCKHLKSCWSILLHHQKSGMPRTRKVRLYLRTSTYDTWSPLQAAFGHDSGSCFGCFNGSSFFQLNLRGLHWFGRWGVVAKHLEAAPVVVLIVFQTGLGVLHDFFGSDFAESFLKEFNQTYFPLQLEMHWSILPSNQDCGPKSTHDSQMTAKITLFTLCKQPKSSLLDLLCSLQVGFRLLHFRLGIFLCALGVLLRFLCSTILTSNFLQNQWYTRFLNVFDVYKTSKVNKKGIVRLWSDSASAKLSCCFSWATSSSFLACSTAAKRAAAAGSPLAMVSLSWLTRLPRPSCNCATTIASKEPRSAGFFRILVGKAWIKLASKTDCRADHRGKEGKTDLRNWLCGCALLFNGTTNNCRIVKKKRINPVCHLRHFGKPQNQSSQTKFPASCSVPLCRGTCVAWCFTCTLHMTQMTLRKSEIKRVILFVFPILLDVSNNDLWHVWLESNIVKPQIRTCKMKCSLETLRAKDIP